MKSKKIIIPLPNYGFDPTEAAIPWKILSGKNYEVTFATPEGRQAHADNKMLTGESLGIWKPILKARKDAVEAYLLMAGSSAFRNPLKYSHIKEIDFEALLLPGGHDKGVKEYLESALLQELVVDFFKAVKPVAAICHGVLLAARSINALTKKSVLYNYKTTCLLKSQELAAYHLTQLWLKDYYLTYPEITVENEVKAALSDAGNFQAGPNPLFRDDLAHLKRGFAIIDRNYVSARWPGDAYTFALALIDMLEK